MSFGGPCTHGRKTLAEYTMAPREIALDLPAAIFRPPTNLRIWPSR
jgi:hypothetical protein